jgi:hypothetical protein
MLGFGAIGVTPIGVGPSGSAQITYTLVANAGSFTETGEAEVFSTIAAETGAQSFAFTGISSPFRSMEAPAAGAFALIGIAATFSITDAVSAGGYVLTGMTTADVIGEPVNPFGAFALTGVATAFSVIHRALPAGSFSLTGSGALLTRDFVNWLERPLPGGLWDNEESPSPSWAAADSQTSSWNDAAAPTPAWSPFAPPSQSWTVDPAQQILPPVSE